MKYIPIHHRRLLQPTVFTRSLTARDTTPFVASLLQ